MTSSQSPITLLNHFLTITHCLLSQTSSNPVSQTEANQWYYDSIIHLHQDVLDIEERARQIDGLQLVTEIGNTTDQGIIIVDDKTAPSNKITLKSDGTSIFEGDMRVKTDIVFDGQISQNSNGLTGNSYGTYFFRVFGRGDVNMGGTLTMRHTSGSQAKIASLPDGEITFGHKEQGTTEVVSAVLHKTPATLSVPLTDVPVMPTDAEKDTVVEVMSTIRAPLMQAATFDIELLPSLP